VEIIESNNLIETRTGKTARKILSISFHDGLPSNRYLLQLTEKREIRLFLDQEMKLLRARNTLTTEN
jgi:hypothetical protein